MSCIDKLLIQGIRSFGSRDEEKAIIQFGTPLTLITGQNGAGKTTIIECLKYVTTGDQPPNTKGGAFVHDPKLVGERDVRAVVKLKFRDISGCMVTCHRMLQALLKPSKIEVKTIDTSLEKIGKDGQKMKLTARSGEVDKEMINHLGVSKAIINSVIFCHQEDSTWPLSEGKALKQRFDDIFASTRYSKALDAIQKIQKEKHQECRGYSTELDYLKRHKLKADELEGELKDTQRKVDVSKADITRLTNELKPIEERKQEMDELYGEADSMKTRIAELESSRRELERRIADLRRKINKPFTGSREELQRLRDNHHSQLDSNKLDLKHLEKEVKLVSEEIRNTEKELSQLYQEQGRKEMNHKHHVKMVEKRDMELASLAKQLGIQGFMDPPFSPATVKTFLSKSGQRVKEEDDKARQEKAHFQEKEEELQREINELRTNLAQIDQSLKMREKTVAENREKMAAIGRKLASLGSGGSALESLQKELTSTERELEDVKAQTDISKMDAALEVLRSEKKKVEEEKSRLQQELSIISRQSGSRGVLEALKRDKREKEERYQTEMCNMEAELLTVLGHIPAPGDRDVASQLEGVEKRKNKELSVCQEQFTTGRSNLSRLQTQLEETEKQLRVKRERVEALESEVSEECGNDDYEEVTEKLRHDIKTNAEDMSAVKGSLPFFRKCLEKIHSTRKCPVCTRGFGDQPSFEKTVKSITDRLNSTVPRLLPTLEGKQNQLQERQKRLQELRPKINELSDLRDREIPRLETDKGGKTAEISKLKQELKNIEEKVSRFRSTVDQIRGLQPKVSTTSQLSRDLEELDNKISSEESKLGSSHSLRSHLIVNRELQDAQMKAEDLDRKMDHKRQQISSGVQEIRQLEQKVNQLRDEKLRLQERLQEKQGLLNNKKELAAIIHTNEREIKMSMQRHGPVEEKLRTKEKEKRQVSISRGEAEAVSKAEVDSLRSSVETIRTISHDINRYSSEGGETHLQQLNTQINSIRREMDDKSERKKELEEKIKKLHKEIANVELQEREWEDQLKLMEVQTEVTKKEREVQKLREKMREMGFHKYDEEYSKLQREQERLTKERARLDGVEQGHEDRVRGLQRDLNGDLYKDAEQKHKDMLITLRTTEMAAKDLEKYYKVLDRAIMRFHKLKMEEINKIIKELWIKTYRGGDIDMIEIRSDDDTEGSEGIKSKRVYHYRVVMLKGDTPLDMRGRCSAGQKMLASIIIRLALAETFCVSCGLLALDEPTTNLDKDNVEGLAQALADIVKDRSSQKNFQLIVITHDTEFVDVLGQAGYTEYYYEVSKEIGETSQIKRKLLSGMER